MKYNKVASNGITHDKVIQFDRSGSSPIVAKKKRKKVRHLNAFFQITSHVISRNNFRETHGIMGGKVVILNIFFFSPKVTVSKLRWGAGRSSSWTHCVVKHKMIPAHGCEGGGATVTPTHTLHKVLVSSISESIEEEYLVSIFCVAGDRVLVLSIKCRDSHFLQFRVQNSKGAVITNGG